MVHYSVVFPQRERSDELARKLPQLVATLDQLRLPYEIVCVDDGSSAAAVQTLEQLQAHHSAMRLLVMQSPGGASVALSVGMAAARGDIVIAIEPAQHGAVEQIPHLIARLSRLDMVYARPRLGGWRKLLHRIGRIPRAMLLGLDVRQPDCLFWAARREAVAGIHLSPGMRRYLPWLVARRGFRVGDIYVEQAPAGVAAAPRAMPDGRRNPLDLLTAWWLCRRWRSDAFQERTAPRETISMPLDARGRQTYRAKSA